MKTGVLHSDSSHRARVLYVPDSEYNGLDGFVYVGCDCAFFSGHTSDESQVSITVTPVDDAPVVGNVTEELECENGVATILLEATDVDAQNITFVIEELPLAANLFDGQHKIAMAELPFWLSGTGVTLVVTIGDERMLEEESLAFAFRAADTDGLLSSGTATVSVTCSSLICDAGSYYDVTVTSCRPCPAGTAELLAGVRSECRACSKGQYSKSNWLACEDCEPNYYADSTRSSECMPCPDGAVCPDGKYVTVLPGKWRTGLASTEMWDCPSPAACVGGNGTELCAKGYSKVLCAVCAPGYYDRQGKCEECSVDDDKIIIRSAIALVLFFCFALGIALLFWGSLFPTASKRIWAANDLFFDRYWDNAKFKVVVSTYQIIASISWSLEVNFPEPYETFQAVLAAMMELSLGRLLPVGCIFNYGFHAHTLAVTIIPLVIALVFVLMWWTSSRKKNHYLERALMVWFLVVPMSSTALFRAFHCQDNFDGGYSAFLIADYSINCQGDAHQKFMLCA